MNDFREKARRDHDDFLRTVKKSERSLHDYAIDQRELVLELVDVAERAIGMIGAPMRKYAPWNDLASALEASVIKARGEQ